MSNMSAYFRLVLPPNPGTLKTDNPGATGIQRDTGRKAPCASASPLARCARGIGLRSGAVVPLPRDYRQPPGPQGPPNPP
jgi:hypothetical protein